MQGRHSLILQMLGLLMLDRTKAGEIFDLQVEISKRLARMEEDRLQEREQAKKLQARK